MAMKRLLLEIIDLLLMKTGQTPALHQFSYQRGALCAFILPPAYLNLS